MFDWPLLDSLKRSIDSLMNFTKAFEKQKNCFFLYNNKFYQI